MDDMTILGDEGVEGEPIVVRRAMACRKLLANMPIHIADYEIVVGDMATGSITLGVVFPHYAYPDEVKEAAKHGFSEQSVFAHHPPSFDNFLKYGLSGHRARIDKEARRGNGKA